MTVEEATRLAERFVDALNRGDRDGWIAAFHPELKGHSGLADMEGGEPYRGLEGAGAWFDNLMTVYETVHARLDQTIVVGDHALQLIRVEYVGRGSGVTLAPTLAWVVEVRDGLYVFAHSYFDLAEGFLELGRRLGERATS
jgi:ketosteroid isomerase-like protein